MNWLCRSAIVGVTVVVFGLMVGGEQNAVLGQKSKDKEASKGGDKGGKGQDPVQRYNHALDTAMKKLKEAEKALLEADVKELNLAVTHPDVVQKLTHGVQLVNHAYALAESCKQVTPQGGGQPNDKKKKK